VRINHEQNRNWIRWIEEALLLLLVVGEYFDHIELLPFTLTKTFGYALAVVFVLDHKMWRRPTWFFLWILAFTAAFTFSTSYNISEIPLYTWQAWQTVKTLVQCVILVYICYTLFSDSQTQQNMLYATVVGSSVVAVLGLLGIAVTEGNERQTFADLDQNFLTVILGIGVVSSFHFILTLKSIVWRMVHGAAGIIMMMFAIPAASRGGQLAIIAGLIAYFVRSKKIWVWLIGIVFLVSFLELIKHNSVAWERTQNALYNRDTAGREEILKESWSLFLERPFLGYGSFNGYEYLGQRLGKYGICAFHNQVLWVMNSTGLVGSAFALFAFVCVILQIASDKRLQEQKIKYAMLALMVVAGLSLEIQHRKIMWVLLALCVSRVKSVSIGAKPFEIGTQGDLRA
jgi:O-antigen ligase